MEFNFSSGGGGCDEVAGPGAVQIIEPGLPIINSKRCLDESGAETPDLADGWSGKTADAGIIP
jgi:hypothetical protein